MTREEEIRVLQVAFKILDRMVKWYHGTSHDFKIGENDIKALEVAKIAIEAMQTEPCGKDINVPATDAISRSELLKAIDTWDTFGCDADTKLVQYQDHYIPYIHYDDVVKCIKGMPSVQPEPKTGRWEYVQYDGNPETGNWHCSECNRIICGAIRAGNPVYAYKYCPECGAKMESEGKE